MDITISQMTFDDIAPIIPYVLKGNMRVRDTKNTIWFGAKVGDELAGIICGVFYTDYVLYNTGFVRSEFRKRGIFKLLFDELEKYVSTQNINLIKAKCTPYSLRLLLKNGFVETGKRKSITYVEKRI